MTWDIAPCRDKFLGLCSANRVIPVVAQRILNADTPISLYETLGKDTTHSFLLESAKEGMGGNRYSFIGYNPTLIFTSKDSNIEITGNNHLRCKDSPFTYLQRFIDKEQLKKFSYISHFYGGYVGYFAYNVVKFFEEIPNTVTDDLEIPDIYLLKIDELIVVDHFDRALKIVVCAKNSLKEYESALEKICSIINKIDHDKNCHRDRQGAETINLETVLSPETKFDKTPGKIHFIRMVKAAKKYIEEGDIYQANLSHRISIKYDKDPFVLYKNIMNINPSPFAGFFKMNDIYLVSSSPERLLRVKDGTIETRPIAGTRPRGKDLLEDSALSNELLLNEKERAEHIMLVDLERNDLGKICKYGSVRVDELMTLEKYSHVWHIVSNIKGVLKDNIKFIEILRACFPGGTITGCPKIRCMEIIDELEQTDRGYYTGSLGYIGYNGDIDLNILIRTILVKENTAYFHVGAGIVADSIPEKEYYETLDKAKAMIEALMY